MKLVLSLLFAILFFSSVIVSYEMREYKSPQTLISESDFVVTGKVLSLEETLGKNQTEYKVQIEEIIHPRPSHNATDEGHIISVVSPCLRYPNESILCSFERYPEFIVGDRVLLFLNAEGPTIDFFGKNIKFQISPYSFSTKSNCNAMQLLAARESARSGLEISQDNQIKHLYTNRPVDLVYYAYDLDLKPETKDFEFKVYTPQKGVILSEKRQIQLQECIGSNMTRWSFTPQVPGKYTFSAILGQNEGGSESISGVLIDIAPPLVQFKSGTDPYYVNCRQDLELVIKSKDNSPACVKSNSLARLLGQGWIYAHDNNGKYAIRENPLQCENKFKPKPFEHIVFPNGTSLTVNYVPVFLMKPDSIGKICITNWSIDKSSNYSGKTIAGVSKDNSVTSDVIIVPYPESITIDSDTNKTIAYTITTSKEANGFYRASPMFDYCANGLPLAVGYNSSHSFDNDFPWLWENLPCPFNPFARQVVGLTGIDVAYITKVYN